MINRALRFVNFQALQDIFSRPLNLLLDEAATTGAFTDTFFKLILTIILLALLSLYRTHDSESVVLLWPSDFE